MLGLAAARFDFLFEEFVDPIDGVVPLFIAKVDRLFELGYPAVGYPALADLIFESPLPDIDK